MAGFLFVLALMGKGSLIRDRCSDLQVYDSDAVRKDAGHKKRLRIKCSLFVVGDTELESVTSTMSTWRSNQLS